MGYVLEAASKHLLRHEFAFQSYNVWWYRDRYSPKVPSMMTYPPTFGPSTASRILTGSSWKEKEDVDFNQISFFDCAKLRIPLKTLDMLKKKQDFQMHRSAQCRRIQFYTSMLYMIAKLASPLQSYRLERYCWWKLAATKTVFVSGSGSLFLSSFPLPLPSSFLFFALLLSSSRIFLVAFVLLSQHRMLSSSIWIHLRILLFS